MGHKGGLETTDNTVLYLFRTHLSSGLHSRIAWNESFFSSTCLLSSCASLRRKTVLYIFFWFVFATRAKTTRDLRLCQPLCNQQYWQSHRVASCTNGTSCRPPSRKSDQPAYEVIFNSLCANRSQQTSNWFALFNQYFPSTLAMYFCFLSPPKYPFKF